jgi:GTP-binding protein
MFAYNDRNGSLLSCFRPTRSSDKIEKNEKYAMKKVNPFRIASYVLSAHELKQLPKDGGIEVAIAGRSNAGKSSAINTFTDQKSLARTSKTPGRTQQIVIFELDEDRRIADLPGYGYAKVPLKLKAHWRTVMARYFETRTCLQGVVLVMDIRHPMREFDQQMLAWCDAAGIPCHILLTKADKLKRGPAQSTLLKVKRDLPASASIQVFSSTKKTGLDELLDKLSLWYEYDDKES